MKFRPLHDRVLVRRVDEDTKTAGGIIIPDSAQEKPSQGEIVAVGNGLQGDDGTVTPLDVKPKDKVLFGKWSGSEVTIDGEEYSFEGLAVETQANIARVNELRREVSALQIQMNERQALLQMYIKAISDSVQPVEEDEAVVQ